jgi:hypothetical protein
MSISPWYIRIARALIITALIFGFFIAVTLLYLGFAGYAGRIAIPGFSPAAFVVLGGVEILGIIVGLLALRTISRGAVRRAGAYALLASFLPPLNLFMLLAVLFLLQAARLGSESEERPELP